jgi:hypothetical protein
VSQTLLDGQNIIRLWRVLTGIEGDRRSFRRSIFTRYLPRSNNFFYLVGFLSLFLWNWKLMMATVTGILSMWLVYRLQGWNWQKYYVRCQRFWDSCDRRLTLAIASGGLGTLTTYTATAILSDTENHWLAFGAIVQGLATLTILLLIFWQLWGRQERQTSGQFDILIEDLTSERQLKRLIAIRKLTRLVEGEKLSSSQHGELVDYFRLLLTSEESPIVKTALLDGLAVLDIEQFIDRPLKIPLVVKTAQKQKTYEL